MTEIDAKPDPDIFKLSYPPHQRAMVLEDLHGYIVKGGSVVIEKGTEVTIGMNGGFMFLRRNSRDKSWNEIAITPQDFYKLALITSK